jgi:hypothetical protein
MVGWIRLASVLRIARLPELFPLPHKGAALYMRWAVLTACVIQWTSCAWRMAAGPAHAQPWVLPCPPGNATCALLAARASAADAAAAAAANCSTAAMPGSDAGLHTKYACASYWAAGALLRVGGRGAAPQSHEERAVFVVALALAATVGLPYLLARAASVRAVLATAAHPAAAAAAAAAPGGHFLNDRLAPPSGRPPAAAANGRTAGADWWRRVASYAARHAAAVAGRRKSGECLAGDLEILRAGGLTAGLRVKFLLQARAARPPPAPSPPPVAPAPPALSA